MTSVASSSTEPQTQEFSAPKREQREEEESHVTAPAGNLEGEERLSGTVVETQLMGCRQTSPMRPMGEILDISEGYSKKKERQTEPMGMLGREERLSGERETDRADGDVREERLSCTVVETQLMGCRQTTPTRPPRVILAIPEGLSEEKERQTAPTKPLGFASETR
ncbi:hypothetical protein FH972_000084 [Carpinus fangiana]|uniref:Uncharacterized protein n=1 Tax=Carpinus fangiana TaxID=176857 RepID=A0A5N6Q7R8_9ROSI|nr:hypothetical protein FH972_000084 [Carpinus fangiana]